MTINNLKPALELWDNGFNVIPVKSKPITPTPENPSEDKGLFKQPLISWKKYQDNRVSREDLYKWYEESPYLNVGIITNGLVIVDADKDEAVLWCHENLSTPVVSKTAKGKHYYFSKPQDFQISNSVNSELGIDIRATGGFVVAPPSVHGSGLVYRWASSVTPKLAEIPEMSREEFEVLQEHLSLNGKCTSPHRNQNQFLIKTQKFQVSKDFLSPVEVGGRNDSLARLTGSLLGRGFSVDQIHHETTKWNQKNTSPLSEDEMRRTVESIINTDDKKNPLKHLTDTSGDEYPEKTLKELNVYAQKGQRGCAELLLKRFKDETLYNHVTKEWLKYDNGVWVKDSISNISWRSQEFLLNVFSKSTHLAVGQEFRLKQLALDDSQNEQELKKKLPNTKNMLRILISQKRLLLIR